MIEAIVAVIAGVVFGVGGTVVYDRRKAAATKDKTEQALTKAQEKASSIVLKAKDEALQ